MVGFVRFVVETLLIVAAASVLAALLFRVAPGADVDSREADARLSESTKAAIRSRRASLHEVIGISSAYYRGVLRGDFGASETSGRPVSELLRERVPSTVGLVLLGSSVSLFLALGSALLVSSVRAAGATHLPSALCSALLAVPSGLVVLLAVTFGVPVEAAVVAIVTPRLFAYSSRLVKERLRADYIVGAECMGIARRRILLHHVLPSLAPEIGGLFSLAVVTALGVSVAVEVLGARPGLGELAWRAAMDRDMPVVVAVTIVILLVVRFGTSVSDFMFALGQRQNDAKVGFSLVDESSMRASLRA